MTHDPYVYRCAPEIAILDVLDAALDIASQTMIVANPGIKSEAPYWIEPALGPAYELDERITELQSAIIHYRDVVTKLLPPDPDLEDFDSDAPRTDDEQLQLPF